MLKRAFIFLISSPFLGGSFLTGLYLSNRGTATCTIAGSAAEDACVQRQEKSCSIDNENGFDACMKSYGLSRGLGTTLIVGSIFCVLGIMFGFKNVLTFTGVLLLAGIIGGLIAGAARRR